MRQRTTNVEKCGSSVLGISNDAESRVRIKENSSRLTQINKSLFQHVSNCILLLTANALGLTSYFVEEKQQRRAFLETRQSLKVKLVIEEQSAEQVRGDATSLPASDRYGSVRVAGTAVAVGAAGTRGRENETGPRLDRQPI